MSERWEAVEVLEGREGSLSIVLLQSGKKIRVFNVAAGIDHGETYPHVTTNISPSLPGSDVEFFRTDEVLEIRGSDGQLVFSWKH